MHKTDFLKPQPAGRSFHTSGESFASSGFAAGVLFGGHWAGLHALCRLPLMLQYSKGAFWAGLEWWCIREAPFSDKAPGTCSLGAPAWLTPISEQDGLGNLNSQARPALGNRSMCTSATALQSTQDT